MNKLLTPKDASKLVGVSLSLIYEWCDERRLPYYRVGKKGKRGRIMIAEEDLMAFLASCRVEGVSPDDGEERQLRHIR